MPTSSPRPLRAQPAPVRAVPKLTSLAPGRGSCWLKFSENPEAPEVNMRHPMRPAFLRRHRAQMADGVPWVSGALLAPGTPFTNGTWGPRAFW